METPHKDLSHEARAYFLQQGQRISKLQGILNSNVLTHHLHKWSSILLQIVLYLLFAAVIVVIIVIPSDISFYFPIHKYDGLMVSYRNEEFEAAILVIKLLMLFISLPWLFLALLLGRNRRRSKLVHEAFGETVKMKEEFDNVVRDLKL